MNPKTKDIELPISGRVVTIRRPPIAPSSLYIDFQQKHPRPTPPKQEVVMMGKAKEWVENLAHPDYPKQVEAWNQMINSYITNTYLKFGVVTTPDDDDLVQINTVRAMLGDLLRDLTDQEVFIKYVLIQGQEDFEALSRAISEFTAPTEAQIANHAERFQRSA